MLCSNKTVFQSWKLQNVILTRDNSQIIVSVFTVSFSWFEVSAAVATIILSCNRLYNQRAVRIKRQSVWFNAGVFMNLPFFKQRYWFAWMSVDPGCTFASVLSVGHIFTRQIDLNSRCDSKGFGLNSSWRGNKERQTRQGSLNVTHVFIWRHVCQCVRNMSLSSLPVTWSSRIRDKNIWIHLNESIDLLLYLMFLTSELHEFLNLGFCVRCTQRFLRVVRCYFLLGCQSYFSPFHCSINVVEVLKQLVFMLFLSIYYSVDIWTVKNHHHFYWLHGEGMCFSIHWVNQML